MDQEPPHAAIETQVIQLQRSKLEERVCNALLESIDETITALLSRNVVDALYYNLYTVHSIPRDEVPYKLETLCTTLNKVFGVRSTATICKAVGRKLFVKLGLPFPNSLPSTLSEYVEEAKIMSREREIQP